jgi:hypothetical protein
MLAVGLSAGALFASSIALAAETGGGPVALGSFRAAGDVGFFAGTSLSIAMVAAIGGEAPSYGDYSAMIVTFAAAHLACTGVLVALARRSVS